MTQKTRLIGRIFWLGDVVIITFPTTTDGPSTDALTRQLKVELTGRRPHGFIFDCLSTQTYAADVRAPGARLLKTLASAGAVHGCCVTNRSSIRMIGTAVAFVAGVSVDFVGTMPEAVAILQGDG
jgi:hypothetical protein